MFDKYWSKHDVYMKLWNIDMFMILWSITMMLIDKFMIDEHKFCFNNWIDS